MKIWDSRFSPAIQHLSDEVNELTGCEMFRRPLNSEPFQDKAKSPACGSAGNKNW